MKILFITDLYPVKEDEKTTPRTLYDFVQGFRKSGHEVKVLKPNFILNSFLRGKPFYKTGQYNDVYNVNYFLPFINVKLPEQLKNFNPDIVLAHMPSGILFAEKLSLPFVAGIHNSDLEVLTNPLYSFYFKNRLKTALNKAKAIACRSEVIRQKLIKLFPDLEEKTFSAPSGIDKSLIADFNKAPLHSPVKVLTCANFKKRKNIDKVIEACKGLESFELTVIGDGREDRNLKKIDKSVKFTGRLTNDKVLEKMRDSDVFVLPSVNETFGMVYLEAMSQGCITICTKDDGISGIIKDGENGFLTLPISTEIRKILLNIKNMDDDTLNTLRYNSLHTIKKFTSEVCCEQYLQQLLKIL